MPKVKSRPSYLLHKASGRGRVRVNGRDTYFSGPYGSAESLAEYDDFCRMWLAKQDPSRCRLTIDDLALLFVDHAEKYYRKGGRPTREYENIRIALAMLVEFCGPTRVRDFGPRKLREFRDSLVGRTDRRLKEDRPAEDRRTLSRQYNKVLRYVVRMFKWGAAEELVDAALWQGLTAVPGLKKGRSEAPEAPKVRPVDDAHVDAVVPHVAPQIAAMIRLQRFTGCRPGEIVELRPCDVRMRTDGLWCYRPAKFKTEHHDDAERVIFIGPQGQEVLRPFLDRRDPSTYCFSPREAMAWRNSQKRAARKSPVQPSQRDRSKPNPKRQPGQKYTEASYCRAIQWACRRHNIPLWAPNQIRHAVGTVVREHFGLEASQVTLGHSKADVTQIYALKNQELAAKVARAIG